MKLSITHSIKFFAIIICNTLFNLDSTAQVANYASLPYYTGFESGVIDSNWYTTSSMPAGRIKIWPSDTLIWGGDTAMAVAGDKFLGMDMPTGGTFNLNQAWLGVNASGFSGLYLSFWWNDWNDETSPDDGVYISADAGVTFVKVLDLLGGSNPDLNWVNFNLNLDSINLVHGLSYSSNYVIKFQQYDDYYLAGGNDGFMFDEIAIGPVVTSTNKIVKNDIHIFPNPTENDLYISGLNAFSNTICNVKNSLGQIVFTNSFNSAQNIKINPEIQAGIYFIELINNNEVIIKEFVKK
ncbi:MAG TPA: T9SS type A sorting domain-containing protein [Bacteroidia bacterium]|nr:T9SS type A sorting domain-containing protein [Bacteroidia bacterium]